MGFTIKSKTRKSYYRVKPRTNKKSAEPDAFDRKKC